MRRAHINSINSSSPRFLQRQDPEYPTTVDELFKPMLWTVNGPGDSDFAIVTDDNVLEVFFQVYKTDTYIGLIWSSTDLFSHAGLAYQDYMDYTGVTWTFDFEVSDTCPVINEPTRAIVFEVRLSTGDTVFVPLDQYSTAPSTRSSRVTLPVGAMQGVRLGDSEAVTIDPTTITRITLGLIADTYTITGDSAYILEPQDCWYRLTTVSVVGGAPFIRANHIEGAHNIGMSTAYDNMHVISPERVITTLKALGYSGRINHYCGVSQYPNKEILTDRVQLVETLGSTINTPCEKWHESLCDFVVAEGWDIIFSISYEMYSTHAKIEYAQRDRDGVLGATGYSPPGYLLIPTDYSGSMLYLGNVFEDFSNIMANSGLNPIMQVGEPFWWFNGDTRKPCFYDNGTLVKFNNETGLFGPTYDTVEDLDGIDLEDTSPLDVDNDTLEQTFMKWLRKELGESTKYLRDRVKTAHPGAEMTVLLFIPSLFNDTVGIISYTNFPRHEWVESEWDFFMTEAYDDTINGKLDIADRAVTLPVELLGYTSDRVQCLVGFVPDEVLAEAFSWVILDSLYKGELWSKITGNIKRNELLGVGRQYIWAYTQVVSDNLVIRNQLWDTVLDRQLLRPVDVKRPARYIDFSGNDGGIQGTPSPPVVPTEFNQHTLGDSFATSTFFDLLKANFGDRYSIMTIDGVGATSLEQQRDRFEETPNRWDYTLIIMDGGLDNFSDDAIAAIDSIVSNLGHDRWVWVEPSPSSFVDGTSERTFLDNEIATIAEHVGEDHYVEVLSHMLAANDGSPGDLEDVANRLVPRSLREDFIHENAAGTLVRTGVIAEFIRLQGY